jgi:hypothetical protein
MEKSRVMRPDHAAEALDAIDRTLAEYHEGVGGIALKALLEAERADYWKHLEADEALGLISHQEVTDIYLRHGWEYGTTAS